MRFEFSSEVTRWSSSQDSWFFAHVPLPESTEIRSLPFPRRGFGSLRVRASIGATTWTTSIFPEGDGRYALPLKRQVREREDLDDGDTAGIVIELIELEP